VSLLESLGVELPVVQAGMGGGIARHELAAAVSEAGGLGTIGIADADRFRGQIAAARSATGKPLAANLLLPFTRRAHCEAAAEADLVVTFWGRPRRPTARPWLHQCGSVEEALDARAAGADGVILQGRESGGHVRGQMRALDLLELARASLPDGYPLLVAGGIADRSDVRAALEAGVEAAVAGTRFLLSQESRAHPDYKRRALAGSETLLTTLFGAGWPALHRVLPNAATERWLGAGGGLPGWVERLQRVTAPVLSRTPEALHARVAPFARPSQPLLAPGPPTDDGPGSLLEAGPLYAGETVARIDEVRPAAEIVRELVP
jgi:NAD(P)H-dependent flavin oxidoreductase YrpB (nitropropane dioxygenase family)